MTKQLIIPSIMAKDQKELNVSLKKLKGVVKELHLDVVDGKFAKNNSLDFKFKLSKNFNYNAHIMVKKPEIWIKKNFNKKIKLYIPQIEEIKNIKNYINFMKKNKKKVGFAIKSETKISMIKPYLKSINYVLILTVKPGFYGSKFLLTPLKKIKQIKQINKKIKIFIDGGMQPKTIGKAVKSGADYFISGSYTTKAKNPRRSIENLMKEIKKTRNKRIIKKTIN